MVSAVQTICCTVSLNDRSLRRMHTCARLYFFIPTMLEPKMFSYTAKAVPEGPTIELFR